MPDDDAPSRRPEPLAVGLALQGGAAHGAFTWGVLDRLLQEPGLRIEGISRTSAGAMNAAVPIAGHAEDGPEGARAALLAPREIIDRVNEISCNPSRPKELRLVAKPGGREGAGWAEMRVHRLASEVMTDLGCSSERDAKWAFLRLLRGAGRRAAGRSLAAHGRDLGRRSTLGIDAFVQV